MNRPGVKERLARLWLLGFADAIEHRTFLVKELHLQAANLRSCAALLRTKTFQKAGLLRELSAQDKKDLELGRVVRVMRDRGNLIHWKTGSWWYGDAYQIPGHPFATPEAALAAGRKANAPRGGKGET